MTRALAVGLAALVLALAPGVRTTVHTGHTVDGRPGISLAARVISEDDPCWDCRTMGNRQCGPAIVHGPFSPTATLDTSQVQDRR